MTWLVDVRHDLIFLPKRQALNRLPRASA